METPTTPTQKADHCLWRLQPNVKATRLIGNTRKTSPRWKFSSPKGKDAIDGTSTNPTGSNTQCSAQVTDRLMAALSNHNRCGPKIALLTTVLAETVELKLLTR